MKLNIPTATKWLLKHTELWLDVDTKGEPFWETPEWTALQAAVEKAGYKHGSLEERLTYDMYLLEGMKDARRFLTRAKIKPGSCDGKHEFNLYWSTPFGVYVPVCRCGLGKGSWKCGLLKLTHCTFNVLKDSPCDHCLKCGQPEERK